MHETSPEGVAGKAASRPPDVIYRKDFDVSMLPDGANSRLATEMVTFVANMDRMMKTHAGKFVAIRGQKILGYGKTRIGTFRGALAKFGPEDVLVKQVSETAPVYRPGGVL